mgnify:CR=1 FL=1
MVTENGGMDMDSHGPGSSIRPLAVAVLVALALAGTAAAAQIIFASEADCIDYACSSNGDCSDRHLPCNLCFGDAGKKRCAVSVDPD